MKKKKKTFAIASTRLGSSEMTPRSSITKVWRREKANSVAASVYFTQLISYVNFSNIKEFKIILLKHTIPSSINKFCHMNIILSKVQQFTANKANNNIFVEFALLI